MNINPMNRIKLYGLNNKFNELINLYQKNKFPNKILLSGQKGIGKCTLAYHLVNYILSIDEDCPYDLNTFSINKMNKSFKLMQNGTNPNFTLLDVSHDKKNIDINQIRELINNLNKSSFNSKPRFILIDNIEYLNLNSINALLKTLEEPSENTFFILINNNKKILPTLLSRCINFKISLSKKESSEVCNNLFEENIYDLINEDLLDYYFSPGKIYNLIEFSKKNEINLKLFNLKDFLTLLINESYYKKNPLMKNMIFDFVELFLVKKVSIIYSDLFSYFLSKVKNIKKFNLDEESFFIEFKTKLLNE